MKKVRQAFDAEYFSTFYENPKTAVSDKDDVKALMRFVVYYLEYLGISIEKVLDMGCGTGMWKDALEEYDSQISYTGVDNSKYICNRYGWKHRSITNFRSRTKYDLIICQGVLQYLKAKDIPLAIDNLTKLCRGALYLQIVTKEDLDKAICDHERTDKEIYIRKASWYRRFIDRYFISCGGGVFILKDLGYLLYELERGSSNVSVQQNRILGKYRE